MADQAKGAAFLDARVPGVQLATELRAEIEALWDSGLPSGDKTGWPEVDKHYTVAPGQVTVLTGWPGSGKSEWLDAVAINLAAQGWKIGFFSPENHPVKLHVSKLLEKLTGRPFGAGPTERIPRDDLPEYLDSLGESFGFISHPDGESLSVKQVLSAAERYFSQYPDDKRGLVIDPWNELEHWRPQALSETEYVSQALSTIRQWARAHAIHVWIVAHPQKMRREDGKLPIPRPDMISGSANFWNKADCCVTVYRPLSGDRVDSQEVEIYVQKVRFKHIGRPGVIVLLYDRVTGRYHEPVKNIYAVAQ